MELITDHYRTLQVDLHARYDYGRGVDATECAAIVKGLLDKGTVLDYGCGQGHLKHLLSEYEVEEYDPAIEEKSELPARADIVVCSDVLEHIEPDCLDEVLNHLRALAKRHIVMVIATKQSNKIMADGRQAHLIVESASWWNYRLSKYFEIDGFNDRSEDGHGILVVARPRYIENSLLPVARIRATTAVENTVRNENVRINSKKIDRRLDINIPKHERVAHLACFGPSLKKTWPELALAKARGEDVFTVSGSHRFLLDKGVVPYAHMDCDPRFHKVKMLGEPNREVRYWPASCIHPDYIDTLKGCDISLWHSYNGEDSMEAFKIDPGHNMVIGGGSIGLRAMSVLYCRGYRNFEIHGMDCSFEDGEHHAGEHLGRNYDPVPVKCKDRWFNANAIMIVYANYFLKQIHLLKKAKLKLHGDGLLQYMYKQES